LNGFLNMQKDYRYIFIVDSMSVWSDYKTDYKLKEDLLLTYDFELKKYIVESGGEALFLDHLVEADTMQQNNFLAYQFFTNWHFNANSKDIFVYKNIPFGLAFRIEFWNDFIDYIRLYISLNSLKKVSYEEIYLLSNNQTVASILNTLNIQYIKKSINKNSDGFYFPIFKWMDEKIRPSGVRGFLYKVREWVTYLYGNFAMFSDRYFTTKNKKTVFIQEYHPTKDILNNLRGENGINVLLINPSRGSSLSEKLQERLLPISGSMSQYLSITSELIKSFDEQKVARLVLSDGSDITGKINAIIKERISSSLPKMLKTLDSCINYVDNNRVDLEILIANIGHTATLFDMVCKQKGVESYLIINGLLGPEYYDEAKYATYINAYSKSIKEYYFRGMENIVILGDPRMDKYAFYEQKEINRVAPTVTIGASGFNSTDLNSYVAVEFDFMYDVLLALSKVVKSGVDIKIIMKVRANGYKHQYEKLVKKFFSHLSIDIIDTTPMVEVLQKSDFYISINSQTLFEASCLGIPAVYYKKDNEIKDPPFDAKSELVTVSNVEDMQQAFYDFQNRHKRYDEFLCKEIMEKYIGPLDGKNLERNLDFIHTLLDKSTQESSNA